MEKVEDYLLKIDCFQSKELLSDFFQLLLQKGKIQDALGINDQQLEEYYTLSWKLLEEKRYEESSDAFFFLLNLNPYYQKFWLGFGIAEQAKENYVDAAFAYLMAQIMKKDDPVPYLNSAKCFLALEEKGVAAENIEQAIKYCGENSDLEAIKSEAKIIQKACL